MLPVVRGRVVDSSDGGLGGIEEQFSFVTVDFEEIELHPVFCIACANLILKPKRDSQPTVFL